jgi:DNA mismatch repair protein MutS
MTPLARASFDSSGAEKRLCTLWQVGSLEGFGSFSRAEIAAMGGLVDYLDLTQRGRLPLLRPPVRGAGRLGADRRRHPAQSEITQALTGGREGSLLSASTAPSPPRARGCWNAASPPPRAT